MLLAARTWTKSVKLRPRPVVLIGTTGGPGRGWTGVPCRALVQPHQSPATIAIAFNEDEPIGDCSYPIIPGMHMVLAQYQDVPGRLSADLGTLQAHPDSDLQRQYIAEAERLFETGSAPDRRRRGAASGSRRPWLPGPLLAVAVVVAITARVVRERRNRLTAEEHLEQLSLRAERVRVSCSRTRPPSTLAVVRSTSIAQTEWFRACPGLTCDHIVT